MVRVDSKLPDGYRLISTAPAVIDHLMLRERAGLSPMGRRQAEAGLRGSWTACHVVRMNRARETVAMGRIIGDGGCFFQVVDMAVLPGHQRRGLGDAVLAHLLDRIRGAAPLGAYVSLLADPPGRRLYAKHGFRETRTVVYRHGAATRLSGAARHSLIGHDPCGSCMELTRD